MLNKKIHLLLISAVLTSCGPLPKDFFEVTSRMQEGLVGKAADKGALPLWINENSVLWTRPKPLALGDDISPAFYSVVEISPQHALPEGNEVIEVIDGQFLLVRSNSLALRSELGMWLHKHSHSHGGLPCGRIFELDLDRADPLAQQLYASGFELTQSKPKFLPAKLPSYLAYPEIKNILSSFNLPRVKSWISRLESLGNRHHAVNPGSSNEIKTMINEINLGKRWAIQEVNHDFSQQKSIILKLSGQRETDEVVILGAHLDTINSEVAESPPAGIFQMTNSEAYKAPGADDNASGVALLVELLQWIETHQLTFDRTVELHFYAAEEIGLKGSQQIASQYVANKTNVVAMWQIDMAGYGSDTVYSITNATWFDLRNDILNWTAVYELPTKVVEAQLSAGTSDHASWFFAGFPTMFAFENPDGFNPKIHTAEDSLAYLTKTNERLPMLKSIADLAFLYLGHYARITDVPFDTDLKEKEKLVLRKRKTDGVTTALVHHFETFFSLFVAIDQEVSQMYLCAVDMVDALNCSGPKMEMMGPKQVRGKNVYASKEDLDLAVESLYRLFFAKKGGSGKTEFFYRDMELKYAF